MPVKLPGPTPTRIWLAVRPSISSAIIGTSRSAWPRPITSSIRATHRPSLSNSAAVQAALDVSKARSMGRIVVTSCSTPQALGLDCFYAFHFGNIVADQAFDPAFEGHGRRGTARAGAVHRQVQMPIAIAFVDDVAAVLGDGRADARFDQLLDLVDD